MRAVVVLLAVALFGQPRPPQPIVQIPATLSYGALLTYGPHPVGWRFDRPVDPKRTYEPAAGDRRGRGPRPVPITVFYPALFATGEESTFGELAELSAYAVHADPPPSALQGARRQFIYDTRGADVARRPVRARRDATPSTVRHPVILFAHTNPVGQLVMSEYLASHGFVVAGVMSKGEVAGSYRVSAGDVRGMVSDLETALRVLLALPFTDRSRVGVIGISNGTFGAVGLGLRHPLAAIVSLEGTIAERAAARILPELSRATPLPPQPPVLHLYTPDNNHLDLAQLKARGPACSAVRMPALAHSDFLSYAVLVPVGPPPYQRLKPAEKFAAISRLTLDFLRGNVVRLTDGERMLGLEQHACSSDRPSD